MPLVINHNLMAMNAARNFTMNYDVLSRSTQRLSSGLRINTSADDAAGLAISELMRADIAALNQGVRNAQDAQSLLQTADGALQVIDEKLIRMKELAEQASTGTYNSVQRGLINNEFVVLRSEIDRIANATKFNGVQLLNGQLTQFTNNPAGLKIHIGPGNSAAQDYYYINIGDVRTTTLGVDTLSLVSQSLAQEALEGINIAIASKDVVRATLGSYINRLSNTISQLSIQAENLQAAESRIRDADIAAEMTEFVNSQIKSQAAIAMLAQANMIPEMALTLIGG